MVINKAIYQRPQAVARAETTILYGTLAELAGLDIHSHSDRIKLGQHLDNICQFEYAHGRPLLPTVVIGERLQSPGKNYFAMARQLGLMNGQTDREYFAKELRRVHAFWKEAPAEAAKKHPHD